MDGINSFTCQCPVGFTGPFCLTEINECDSRPCLNKGSCVDSLGTYRCICPLGYTGKNCQVGDIFLPVLHRVLLFERSSSRSERVRCEVPNVAELLFLQFWEEVVDPLASGKISPAPLSNRAGAPVQNSGNRKCLFARKGKCLVIYEDRCHWNFLD